MASSSTSSPAKKREGTYHTEGLVELGKAAAADRWSHITKAHMGFYGKCDKEWSAEVYKRRIIPFKTEALKRPKVWLSEAAFTFQKNWDVLPLPVKTLLTPFRDMLQDVNGPLEVTDEHFQQWVNEVCELEQADIDELWAECARCNNIIASVFPLVETQALLQEEVQKKVTSCMLEPKSPEKYLMKKSKEALLGNAPESAKLIKYLQLVDYVPREAEAAHNRSMELLKKDKEISTLSKANEELRETNDSLKAELGHVHSKLDRLMDMWQSTQAPAPPSEKKKKKKKKAIDTSVEDELPSSPKEKKKKGKRLNMCTEEELPSANSTPKRKKRRVISD